MTVLLDSRASHWHVACWREIAVHQIQACKQTHDEVKQRVEIEGAHLCAQRTPCDSFRRNCCSLCSATNSSTKHRRETHFAPLSTDRPVQARRLAEICPTFLHARRKIKSHRTSLC